MTIFAQHPRDATPVVPHHATQESNAQQYMPVTSTQQHPAMRAQPYPDQYQQYHQPGHIERPDQVPTQDTRPTFLAVTSYGPSTTGYDHGQQLPPALDQRHSESSFRSVHSHKSTHSTKSHHSHHSTKSAHSHRSHHSHRDSYDELKHRKKRDIDARPTMGDSVMLVVNHFRDLLSGDRR